MEKEVISLVKELAKTIKKVGVKKVYKVLSEISVESKANDLYNDIINNIIHIVCDSYNVSVIDIKRKNIRGNIIEAREMCFILLKKHIDLTHIEIAQIFHRKNHTLISQTITKFKKRDIKIKSDKMFLDNYNALNKKIINHIEIKYKL